MIVPRKTMPPRAATAAVAALALAAALAAPSAAAPREVDTEPGSLSQAFGGDPAGGLKVSAGLETAEGEASVYVRFAGRGAFEQTQPAAVRSGTAKPVDAQARVRQIRAGIEAKGRSVAAEAGASVIYATTDTIPGVALRGDAARLRGLANRSDVVSVSAIVPKTPDNGGAVVDTKALEAWTALGEYGEGVTIAVIDSGVDYTHTAFGGPGTEQAYAQAQSSSALPSAASGLRDAAKVVGGWDLVGDSYNADPADPGYQPVPRPDPNPLDCSTAGHGTHVAGSAAGYGVDADGSTFRGDYSALTEERLDALRIGPGTAPLAKVVGLRVFGCGGSSSVVGQALDRVLDPDGDGDFSDRARIVNMSLGSDRSPVDDPENAIVDSLTAQGVLSVVASGNAGDVTDVGGSPGNARSALTVANTVGSRVALDRVDVPAPADVAGEAAGQYSANFDYAEADPARLAGTVAPAPAGNRFGCQPFAPGSLAGKWVWLQWEQDGSLPCGSGARFDNAQAAGALGVVLDSPDSVFEAGIAGNAGIPGVQLNAAGSATLRPAAAEGTLQVRLSPDYLGAGTADSNALDTLNPSSSRGVHGSEGVVKPDVAAPGTAIGSAHVATGNGVAAKSGTSMAAPHTAGLAALVAGSGSYTPLEIKGLVMNTAAADVRSPGGAAYGPTRVGSGRVVAAAALHSPAVAYATGAQDLVSVVFGVEEAVSRSTTTKSITVENLSGTARTYRVEYVPAAEVPGAVYTLGTSSVTVPAHGTATVEVTLAIDPARLAKTPDPAADRLQGGLPRQWAAEASGRVVLTADGLPELRVPVHAAPKPASAMSAGQKLVFPDGSTESTVALAGRGLDQGAPGERYLSLLSAYELGAKSPRLNAKADLLAGARAMDLQYVGAASTAPVDGAGGLLSFGVSTWGNWAHLAAGTRVGVDIDTDGDGTADFLTATWRLDGLDLDLAATFDLATGRNVDLRPVNGLAGDTDANTFDTNVASLPVSLAALGLDGSATAPIRYRVATWSDYKAQGRSPVDSTKWIDFDAADPDLWFEGDGAGTVFVDHPGLELAAHRKEGADSAQALFLHHHNATGDLSGKSGEDGGKAEVLNTTGK